MTRRLEDVVADGVAEHVAGPVDAEALLAAVTARSAVRPARWSRPAGLVLAAAAGVACVVAGVWLLGGRATSGDAVRPPAASAPVSTAPAQLDCGTFELGQLDRTPATALTCLVDAARDGTPARLAVTMPTVEGDPIATTYTVLGADTVRVVTDSSRDRFGGGPPVLEQTCHGARVIDHPLLGFASCTEPVPAR